MSSVPERGYSLVSQQIRRKIVEGRINVGTRSTTLLADGTFEDRDLESRIQPSSFEPQLGGQVFILDPEHHGAFRPQGNEVYRALLELPRAQRQEASLEGGFELKTGFTYLIPLEERVTLGTDERLRASPKSTSGRVFPRVRMLADYSSAFDSVFPGNNNEGLKLWLLVQPTAFNLVVEPGISLNQLRFFKGNDASLTEREIRALHQQSPLIYTRGEDGLYVPGNPVITDDGMQLNLDLKGTHTKGIIGLRARKTPEPVDMRKTGHYDPALFFEPVQGKNGSVRLESGQHYLFASAGKLQTPNNVSSELRRHSGVGIRGSFDEAGFIDNGFEGDLVAEVVLDEKGGIVLKQDESIPFSALEFFRSSEIPDKIYGPKIGSHYNKQIGPRVSKHFRAFDFDRAAKNHQKLNREVIVHNPRTLMESRLTSEGFEPIHISQGEELVREIENNGFFHSRYDCEDDERVLQVIPYVVLFGPDRTVFSYARASHIDDYGDERLFGKLSIGVGGHVSKVDGPHFIRECIDREVKREEVKVIGTLSEPQLMGTLFARDTPVDRVHFGLVYAAHVDGTIEANEKSISLPETVPFVNIYPRGRLYETWSRILIPHLDLLYDSSKK